MTSSEGWTPEDFDRAVRHHEQNDAIPWRLKDIEDWVATVRSTPNDIRNTPDKKRGRDGRPYASGLTDLASIKEHVEAVRSHFEAGDFLLAIGSLRGLESRVAQANARLTAHDLDIAKRVRSGGPKGRAAKEAALAGARERHKKCADTFRQQLRRCGGKKMRAYAATARLCQVSVRTVREAVRRAQQGASVT